MDQQKCRICGERHRLGSCPSTASSSGARRVANRQLPTPTAPPPKGDSRDSVQASGAEDGIALSSTSHPKGLALKRGRPTKVEAARRARAVEVVEVETPDPPIVGPGLKLGKRAPRGTFDRTAYQRDLMRRRRLEAKQKQENPV